MRRRNVAYIKVENHDNYEVEIQKLAIDNYAKEKGFKIDYYYIDDGYYKNILERLELRQLLRDIKSKKISDRIIIQDTSILSKNENDIIYIINKIAKSNVKLISINEKENEFISTMNFIIKKVNEDELNRKKMAASIIGKSQ